MPKLIKAVAYIRTSSGVNVGADKDSGKRQRQAIQAFARRSGFEIVSWYNDEAVSGADPIETRKGFRELLDRIEANGVRTVIVEDASRFARQLVIQEAGVLALVGRGVTVMTSSGDNLTETSDPYKIAMRQMAGVFAQLEKSRLVSKLKGARDRKRATGVKVEGRKGHSELRPDVVALAKKLRRASPKTGKRRSLREIAGELAKAGHLNERGQPFAAQSIRNMLSANVPGPAVSSNEQVRPCR